MFCNQCEQTAKGKGCTLKGVCGKSPDVAALQDVLVHVLKDLSLYAREGRKIEVIDSEVNVFTPKALFSTLTNVNFDAKRFQDLIKEGVELTASLKKNVGSKGGQVDPSYESGGFKLVEDLDSLLLQAQEKGTPWNSNLDEDIQSLQQILLYGLKGVAAYAHHAYLLGKEDEKVYAFIHEGLAAIAESELSRDDWVNLVLRCGEINLLTMELLDAAHTETYGHPVPTEVPLGHEKGKCILVSGHDLKDLKELLEETEGEGIRIYTHGEMLPAHGYPELKKYKHFYGHYGTAWQNQIKEFADFPGAILMTTNCIQKPKEIYHENIFTTGLVGWPEATHVDHGSFAPVIEKAHSLPGFLEEKDEGSVMVGFGHNAVISVADKVIAGVKGGHIKHFFLVAGCDGAKPGRNYYTEFVEKAPHDSIILTLACGKYRFFDKKLGTIGGIPRLLDVGQCNDAYSAIKIAQALAEAFDSNVNDLPLSMILSWYEQKAVAILLSLFYLGIKDIRLGPTLPAFVTPNVLDVLVQNFNLMAISTPDEDLAFILS